MGWSKEDDNFLISNFLKLTYKELANKLDVSETQINKRARLLNLRKKEYDNYEWTNERETFLLENFNNMTYEELAKNLNASINQILRKTRKLNLKKNNIIKKEWDEDKVNFIEENFNKMKCSRISEITGMLEEDIYRIAAKAGITKNFKWKESDVLYLKENAGKLELKEIAIQLNIPYKIVKGKAYRLGIRIGLKKTKPNREFGENEKQCNKCKSVLPKTREFFGSSKSSKDGFN